MVFDIISAGGGVVVGGIFYKVVDAFIAKVKADAVADYTAAKAVVDSAAAKVKAAL